MSLGSNNNDPVRAKRAGVRTARSALTPGQKGEPNKLVGVSEAKVIFVTYNDERGNPTTAMYFEVNGVPMTTADTTDWCRRLHPMADWLKPLVAAARSSKAPAADTQAPCDDAVDVIG